MANPWEFLTKPEILRELRGVIADAFGFALALAGARKLRRGYQARKEKRNDGGSASNLADAHGRAHHPAITHCVHCGRSFRDVETLGCGGTDRKGSCPRSKVSR